MDAFEPSAPFVTGGIIVVLAVYVAREVASGALHAAGHDLWRWLRRRAER